MKTPPPLFQRVAGSTRSGWTGCWFPCLLHALLGFCQSRASSAASSRKSDSAVSVWSAQEGFSGSMRFPEVPFLPYVLNKTLSHTLSRLLQYDMLRTNAHIFRSVGMPRYESWMESKVVSGTWTALVPPIISFPVTRLSSKCVLGCWCLDLAASWCLSRHPGGFSSVPVRSKQSSPLLFGWLRLLHY